ncbi:MAG: D-alanyl-D-alanine carboxypeptidase family protein [Thermoanaerobaculia bacterium]
MKRLSIAIVLILIATTAMAQQENLYDAAILMEPSTRTILYQKNPHEALPSASMTKMVTLLVVMDAINNGLITWDTPVTVSAHASKMGGSQVYLKQGEVFPVRDLVAATMIHSANDAAEALAERVAGTEQAFVVLMNEKAKQLGLKDSHFYSPHGLPERGGPDDVMSPYDLAITGIEVMKHPELRKFAAVQQMPFRDGKFGMTNPNHLLSMYPGANGIKTGYHAKAGFCVTGSAQRGNMDLVVVVMGSKRKRDNFASAAELLSLGFARYAMIEPVKKGQDLAKSVPIAKGKQANVPVVAGKTVRVLVKRGEKEVSVEVAGTSATAPIKKGQQVGWAFVRLHGQPVAKIPAVAAAAVEPQAWWRRWSPF